MITPRNVQASLVALAASFMCTASATYGAVYTWTDDRGTRTYSSQPPDEPDKVRGFAVVEDIRTPRATPVREAPRVNGENAVGTSIRTPRPLSASARVPAKFGESFRPNPARSTENSASTKEESDTAARELWRIHARGRTETVRDPCLISSDPRCYERNKDQYHPYFGYAPSVMQPTPGSATGATSAAIAGGAVAGHVSRETTPASRRLDPPAPGIAGR